MIRTVTVSVRFERWELGAFLHLSNLYDLDNRTESGELTSRARFPH